MIKKIKQQKGKPCHRCPYRDNVNYCEQTKCWTIKKLPYGGKVIFPNYEYTPLFNNIPAGQMFLLVVMAYLSLL